MDSTAIFDAVRSVTGAWARQRKAEEREAARLSRRRDALVRSRRMTVREAAWQVMPQAYLKASSNGTLPAHARQIMYAARGEIQRLTGRTLDDQYFTQQLLPDFMNEHPSATAEWDVVFDARGHFHEPHTGRIVPLGTIEVRRHLREVAEHTLPELQVGLPEMAIFPTCGPGHRYGAILFVEKEGFLPLFRAVRLAERYDLAIMSTKGLSVTASRLLVDRLCAAHEVPLLVLHDFDKSGFSILGTLRRDTRRYAFRNRIEVVDLGLRLEDVEDSGLETEDVVHRSDPAPNLRENGATAEEIAFLRTPAGRAERVRQRRLRRLDRAQARAARRGQDRARRGRSDAGLPPERCFPLRRFATAERDPRGAAARSRSARAGRPRHARCGRAAGRSRAVVGRRDPAAGDAARRSG